MFAGVQGEHLGRIRCAVITIENLISKRVELRFGEVVFLGRALLERAVRRQGAVNP